MTPTLTRGEVTNRSISHPKGGGTTKVSCNARSGWKGLNLRPRRSVVPRHILATFCSPDVVAICINRGPFVHNTVLCNTPSFARGVSIVHSNFETRFPQSAMDTIMHQPRSYHNRVKLSLYEPHFFSVLQSIWNKDQPRMSHARQTRAYSCKTDALAKLKLRTAPIPSDLEQRE